MKRGANMSNIVGVKFQSRHNPEEFGGREYSYRSAIELSPGDIVAVPTANGEGVAQVTSVNVPESKVDERILPNLKTIERRHGVEGSAQDEPGDGDDPVATLPFQATGRLSLLRELKSFMDERGIGYA